MIPVYRVNLDKNPEERWTQVILGHEQTIRKLSKEIEPLIKTSMQYLLPFVPSLAYIFFPNELRREIKGIAKITDSWGISYEKLILLNVTYELSCGCTSGILRTMSGDLMHVRSLDWDLPTLRALTVRINFINNKDDILMTSTTWAGFVGILTGMRRNGSKVSISLNFRKPFETKKTFIDKLFGFGNITSFAIRDVLLNFESFPEFDDVVERLSEIRLAAPCYLIICGEGADDAVILTRDCAKTVYKDATSRLHKKNWIVQTNHDDWQYKDFTDPEWYDNDDLLISSFDRKQKMIDSFKHYYTVGELIPFPTPDDEFAFQILNTIPILNKQTIYQTVMNPKSDVYVDRPK